MRKETINKIYLRGFVHRDPQIRYYSDTNIKAYFPLLTFDLYKSQNEEKLIPEYHNIIAWKVLAQKIEEQIKEGQFVEISGRLKTNKYEKDGEMKLAVQIVISEIEILNDVEEKKQASYPPSIESNKNTPMNQDLFESEEADDLPF